jgi:hypothetical protein
MLGGAIAVCNRFCFYSSNGSNRSERKKAESGEEKPYLGVMDTHPMTP